jgi:kynureninase
MSAADRFQAATGIYLLSHSVGRPPVGLRERVREQFFDPWEAGAGEPWSDWLAVFERFGAQLATLFNSEAANFCPQLNLSSGLSKILLGLPPGEGRDVLLLSEDDFPSMGFVLQQARRPGQQLRFIPSTEDVTDPAVWERYLDERVELVLVSHVHSNTGRQLPVAEILALARALGVMSVVDIAQSAGVLPIDLAAWGADFVLGSCVKWLCGGPGAGFLWARPERVAACEPRDVGWYSHARPFEFDIHHFEYHPQAQRFWGGTPSVLPYAVASVSLETINAVGVEAIRAHNLSLGDRLIAAAGPGALRSPLEPARRSGTVVVDAGEQMDVLCAALDGAGVYYDRRSRGLRLSPHIYNTPEEVDRVATLIHSICR